MARPFRLLSESTLPFAPYHLDLSAHLCQSGRKYVDEWRFHLLSPSERRRVIQHGLDGGRLVRRLYAAAVFIAQVGTFAGIYDDDRGCSLIEYPGRNQLLNWSRMSYQDLPDLYAADATCPGGQPG